MSNEQWSQLFRKIRNYLDTPTQGPLFIALDDPDELATLRREASPCRIIRLSDYCPEMDTTPNEDRFRSDLSFMEEPLFLLGIGEYVALFPNSSLLYYFKALRTSGSEKKIILPIWNGYGFLQELRHDPRFSDDFVHELPVTKHFWFYKNIAYPYHAACEGFKAFLKKIEDGYCGEISIRTNLNLNEHWGQRLDRAYVLYQEKFPCSHVPETMFSQEQWEHFLEPGRIQDTSLFSADSLLECLEKGTDNIYLQRVVEVTQNFADFKQNFIRLFLDLDPQDPAFLKLSLSRKKLLDNLAESDWQKFFSLLHRFDKPTRLLYLTDTTLQEKWEILKILTERTTSLTTLKSIYSDLALYLENFDFAVPQGADNCLFEQITNYFTEYKLQKIYNSISQGFMNLVEDISQKRPYNLLQTRSSLLEKINKEKSKLYWVDSLGCEYLSYLCAKAQEKELTVNVHAARANLPTITSVNKNFYEEWRGDKVQSKKLDAIKHGNYEVNNGMDRLAAPLHLALELDILNEVMDNIARDLRSQTVSRVILTSDHGATRLAVIRQDLLPWEMPEPGVHGGRCCKVSEFDGVLPESVTSDAEDKWHVLANYLLFKGGRPGSVEVHGGASLEEVVIPILEFTLKEASPTIIPRGALEFITDYKTKTIVLSIFCSARLAKPSLHYSDKIYPFRETPEKGVYTVEIPPPTKAGQYKADVYDKDNFLTSLKFTIKKSIAETQDDFF